MDNCREELLKEIERGFTSTFLQSPNSDGYSVETERLCKLYALKIDEDKAEKEAEIKIKQLSEGKKDRVVKIVLETAAIIVPLSAYGIWFREGLKFETEGTLGSSFFRNFLGKLNPKKW